MLFEYRILHRDDWFWPYYIQRRPKNWLKIFGWVNISIGSGAFKNTKTFESLDDAKDYVFKLIAEDSVSKRKVQIDVAWTQDDVLL